MSLFAIGDLHLSFGSEKPMDIFSGWENHAERLAENWQSVVGGDDTVVLCGDSSWGMTLDEALPDFKFIDALNGKQKLILKGNHDYWWGSASKMKSFFESNGLNTLFVLHNNAYEAEGFKISGSRGWIFENGQPHDDKIINREAARIELSLNAAGKLSGTGVMFLHYPPVFMGQELTRYLDLMRGHGIKHCYYGHIHGAGHKHAVKDEYKGIRFGLVAADYLNFCPYEIK